MAMTLPNSRSTRQRKRDNGRPEAYPGCDPSRVWIGGLSLDDVGPRLSKLILFCAALNAGLHLAASIKARGLRRSALFFALGTGLPAAGELLATGPSGSYAIACATAGGRAAGHPPRPVRCYRRLLRRCRGEFRGGSRPGEDADGAVPALAALVGVGLDLIWIPPASTSGSGSGTSMGPTLESGGAKRTWRSTARQLPRLDLAGRGRGLRLRARPARKTKKRNSPRGAVAAH